MSIGRKQDVLKGLRTLFEVGSIAGLSDAELLERSMVKDGGATAELAFSALVERHGPMVLRVCRKALGDPHDAHDAFQSTFLVLARKADSIRDRRSVASFLHGVALRVSASCRVAEARRRKHERTKAEGMGSLAVMECPDDMGAVLHEEVGRLPGRYRDAVVLCYLEGRSYEEVAGHLSLPVGTVKSRLAWARQRLRDRLVRRGLAPAAGAVATMLAAEAAHASISLPSTWVESTVETALKFAAIGSGAVPGASSALANSVLHAMMMNKIKFAAVAIAGLLTTSAVLLAQQAPPSRRSDEPDRLSRLENKLDRLISAMERQADRDLPKPAYAPTPDAPMLAAPAAERGERTRAAAAPRAAMARIAPPVQDPVAVRGRRSEGGSIEERLSRLEERMDRLERQVRAQGGPARAEGRIISVPVPGGPAGLGAPGHAPVAVPGVPAVPATPAAPAAPAPPTQPAPPEGALPPPAVDSVPVVSEVALPAPASLPTPSADPSPTPVEPAAPSTTPAPTPRGNQIAM